ncbi:hypothetical protein ACFVFS_11225 [Kitasatospora sp. NPDC057692]|uniref:hypothetical protein n=1 Tax=Kitasatospora sp. NPDC057692 TaxID=3346215 RepID=UPI00367E42F4
MPFRTTARRRWALGLTAAAVAGAAILFTGGPDEATGDRPTTVTPSNLAGRRTACLAGDATEAATGSDAGAIWSALQDAARQGDLNAQQFFVPAPTADQALPYLAGLSAQRCDLVVTIGPTFGQALGAASRANPRTRFVAVAAEGQSPPNGTETVSGSSADNAREIHRRVLELSTTESQ